MIKKELSSAKINGLTDLMLIKGLNPSQKKLDKNSSKFMQYSWIEAYESPYPQARVFPKGSIVKVVTEYQEDPQWPLSRALDPSDP